MAESEFTLAPMTVAEFDELKRNVETETIDRCAAALEPVKGNSQRADKKMNDDELDWADEIAHEVFQECLEYIREKDTLSAHELGCKIIAQELRLSRQNALEDAIKKLKSMLKSNSY